MLMGQATEWSWDSAPPNPREPGTWVDLNFSLDIYNASENTPNQNRLLWGPRVPIGWQIHPQEQAVPRLETYRRGGTRSLCR